MPLSSATEQSLSRVFTSGFAARDLAEPLASFDAECDVALVRDFMVRRPLQVVGIRRDGLVVGFIEQGTIDERPLAEQARPVAEAAIVSTATEFRDVILTLNERPFVMVAVLGQPVGVIMRDDLHKAPFRMWMFGMVTLIEMRLTRIIRTYCPDDTWHEFLSDSRVEKARQLQEERARRNQNHDLIDCLQFGDKGQLFARSQDLREKIRLSSRREVERAVKGLERLRNNLAHAQDIVSESWEMIVNLATDMDSLLAEPDHLPPQNSHTPYVDPPAVDS